jgi:hypothetical protein
MASIGNIGGNTSHVPRGGFQPSRQTTQSDRPTARVRVHTESTQSSLTLKVRTAEGDTVELSLNASDVKETDRGYARTSQGKVQYKGSSEATSVDLKLKINGDLNDKELADIKSLLQSLETGQPVDSQLSSLSAYKGAFSQTSSVSDTVAALYG